MNFWKSLLSDDPDPPNPQKPQDSEPGRDHDDTDVVSDPDQRKAESSGGGMWGFGGLIQNLTTRSESVLETYRRDLQEFGSGLKKETELFREVASRAVKELPASIEVAHGAIDGVIKSTAEIISHSKETLLPQSANDVVPPETPERSVSSGRYSWFEAQLTAIQNDVGTFCEEPEDLKEYSKWKLGFVLTEKSEEIENLIGENGALEGMHKRVVVSNEVDQETFWCRYFYRVDKLKQQESVRAKLVKRAITIDDDEEELSWDVDDDDDEDNERESSDLKPKADESVKKELGAENLNNNVEEGIARNVSVAEESGENKSNVENEHESSDLNLKGNESVKKELGVENSNKNVAEESARNLSVAKESGENKSNMEHKGDVVSSGAGVSSSSDEKVKSKGSSEVNSIDKIVISEESSGVSNAEKLVKSEGKSDQGGLEKDSDVSVVSSQQSVPEEEEDMGWDEIEDVDSNDEKKVSASSGSASRVDVRKQLSAAEEDEDLSWDIEDDD